MTSTVRPRDDESHNGMSDRLMPSTEKPCSDMYMPGEATELAPVDVGGSDGGGDGVLGQRSRPVS